MLWSREIADAWRRLPMWLVLVAALAVLLALVAWGDGRTASCDFQDFVEYWGAGRLNLVGENPYDPATLFPLERTASPSLTDAIMMWNPPWTLPLVMPFGLLSASAGYTLWLAIQLFIVLVCADWLWSFYGGPARLRWVGLLASLGFVPTLFVFRMGQISPLILLAITGFLYFERRGWGTLAGAAVALAAIKPHLVLVFGAAVFLWVIRGRKWSVLLGALATLSVLTGLAVAFNPQVLSHYASAMGNRPPQWLSPTLGSALRVMFGVEHFRLQFVFPALGLGWLVFYWLAGRKSWNWAREAPLLLLVSFLTAPYGAWPFDLVILLVPLVQCTSWVVGDRQRSTIVFAAATYISFDVIAFMMRNIHYTQYYWYAWMTPMLLFGYLSLRKDAWERAMDTPKFAPA